MSFLMPVYGGEKYVADAIESVLEQSFDPVELVIVNDGSPDNSDTDAITATYQNGVLEVTSSTA